MTGGIGAGKSQVAHWLARECACALFDADAEVRALLVPGESGWQALRNFLPPLFFTADGLLRKDKLRQSIFADEALRRAVEQAIHPLVLASLQTKVSTAGGRCLVEVPLLFEVEWQEYFAGVLVVYAEESICRDRVMSRDGIRAEQAMAIIRAQMPMREKARLADYRVDNSGAWPETVRQLEKIKKKWLSQYGEKKLDRHIV